ncbi:MAG: nucleotidyltransferase domain-containing protein [Candidatus Eisenbacteria bacterium]|nr:nucleotidyltransferase domain-containing protein [Candidatus Eisenbacteria bacterium]
MLIPIRRKKILGVFSKDPFKEIHLREIARLSKVSLNNVDNSLRLFVKEDMFKRREVSNMVFFKPSLESESLLKLFEYLELETKREFFRKNKNIARLLQKYTEDVVSLSNKRIQLVVLFGSVARGEWTKASDVDILVAVSGKDSDVTALLKKAEIDVSPLLEIRPISTSTEKFAEGIKKKTEFYDDLWRDRIVLYNEFLFWQMIKEAGRSYAQGY